MVGLLIWNIFLKKVLECYFEALNYTVMFFESGQSSYHQEVIGKLKKLDIFVLEAFNPLKIEDPEGFRLALKLRALQFSAKPIVVFQSLNDEFLASPFLMDYSTLHNLPDKIRMLGKIESLNPGIFDRLIAKYPILNTMPVHQGGSN